MLRSRSYNIFRFPRGEEGALSHSGEPLNNLHPRDNQHQPHHHHHHKGNNHHRHKGNNHHHPKGNKGPYISEDKRYIGNTIKSCCLGTSNTWLRREGWGGVMGKGEKSIHGEVDCRVAKCHESRGYICVKKLPKAEKGKKHYWGFSVFSWCQRFDILHQQLLLWWRVVLSSVKSLNAGWISGAFQLPSSCFEREIYVKEAIVG